MVKVLVGRGSDAAGPCRSSCWGQEGLRVKEVLPSRWLGRVIAAAGRGDRHWFGETGVLFSRVVVCSIFIGKTLLGFATRQGWPV